MYRGIMYRLTIIMYYRYKQIVITVTTGTYLTVGVSLPTLPTNGIRLPQSSDYI